MSITAKFGAKCLTCGKWIDAGAKVMYEPGQGIRHPRGGCKAAESAQPKPAARKDETLGRHDAKIIGRAEYKSHDYLLLWEGMTSRGTQAARLAFRDGSKVFWADGGTYRVTKTYRDKLSIADLDHYAAQHKEREKDHSKAGETISADDMMTRASGLAAKAGVELLGKEPLALGQSCQLTLGEVVEGPRAKKTDPVNWVLVVALGKYDKWYASRDDLEDMDDFRSEPGWQEHQEFFGVACSEPPAERQAREAREAKEQQVKASAQAKADAWAAAKAEIPGDYKTRHGAMLAGTVSITSQSGDTWTDQIIPVAYGFLQSKPDWQMVSSDSDERYGNTLYCGMLSDGRPVYRITHIHYDDYRETYYFPEDVWQAVTLAEIKVSGITREKAQAWLAEYRGCVGTEMYELAATIEPAPIPVSSKT